MDGAKMTHTTETRHSDQQLVVDDTSTEAASFEHVSDLPQRAGPPPRTGSVAHGQLDQNGPVRLQEALWERMRPLDGVRTGHSGISSPESRALHLEQTLSRGPDDAFIVGNEFAHLHGAHDGSLHVTLPEGLAQVAIDHSWAELHPVARVRARPATLVMVYSPRHADELETVWRLVQASYAFARGEEPGERC
jgi:Family of unknown function (DUF5519)